jgi:hypothetical protein
MRATDAITALGRAVPDDEHCPAGRRAWRSPQAKATDSRAAAQESRLPMEPVWRPGHGVPAGPPGQPLKGTKRRMQHFIGAYGYLAMLC